MDKLTKEKLQEISGGALTNRECMYLGGLATLAAFAQSWPSIIGVTATAVVGGCFSD